MTHVVSYCYSASHPPAHWLDTALLVVPSNSGNLVSARPKAMNGIFSIKRHLVLYITYIFV